MITATLQEAKSKLHKLVEAVERGEQVVLMRGPHIVATIQPLSATDVEIASALSDVQAEHFWEEVASEETKSFPNPQAVVEFLRKQKTKTFRTR